MDAQQIETPMQVGGYCGIDTATGKDKNVAGVWRNGKLLAAFEGEDAFGRALEYAGIKQPALKRGM